MSIADYYVDTGIMDSEQSVVLSPSLAVVYGPASVQAEYMHARVASDTLDSLSFNGFYVYGSYFITGENRVYKQSSGKFVRVRPYENFLGEEDGWGALELAVRYSWIDLNDGTVTGGELADVTAGVNWLLNPYVRLSLNYVYADLDTVGKTNGLMTRFQFDF
jgi:phosphate-selective porin OprO/OprP